MPLINGKALKLAVFDMDGLLLDSEKIYFEKWRETANILGYEMTHSQWCGLMGTNEESEKRYLRSLYGDDCPVGDFRRIRLGLINEYADRHGFPLKKGVRELIAFLGENGVRSVVATSSERVRAEKLLSKAGITELFSAITCGNEVMLGKPDPALFLKAAEKAGAEPNECAVFEDSENGIIAAKNAGMIPVFVPDMQPPTEYVKKTAVIINSLDEFISLVK